MCFDFFFWGGDVKLNGCNLAKWCRDNVQGNVGLCVYNSAFFLKKKKRISVLGLCRLMRRSKVKPRLTSTGS